MTAPAGHLFARSLLFNAAYLSLTLSMMIAGLPILLLSAEWTRRYVRLWTRLVMRLLRLICHIRYEVRGQIHITSQPVIYASQHQSAWDILILVLLLPSPLFVLKRELLWIPLAGWYMQRFGIIAIDRGKRGSALKRMVGQAKDALYARRPLVIFPEGTRRVPGNRLAILPGVAALYGHLMVPVVPVALNSGCFWGRNAFTKKPGTMVIEFLPAISPGLPPREMVQVLGQAIEGASAKLLAETSRA